VEKMSVTCADATIQAHVFESLRRITAALNPLHVDTRR